MGKASDEIKKLQKDLADLKNKLSSFKDIEIKVFNEASNDAKELNTHIDAAEALLESLKPDLDYISASFKDSINSLQKTNYFIELQKKGLKGIASQADMISSIKRGELDTDAKSIKKQQEKYRVNLKNLEAAQASGEISGEALKALNNQIKEAKVVQTGFEEVLKVNKDINKELGAGPALAGGIDKALQKIGFPSLGISDAVAETQALGQAAIAAGEEFKAMPVFLNKIGNNIKGAFSKANILQGGIALITKSLLEADKATGEMAKSLNITYTESLGVRENLTGIANSSNDTAVSTRSLHESHMAINAAIGARVNLDDASLVTMSKMREQAGLTNDEILGLISLNTQNNQTQSETNQQLLGAAKAYAGKNKLAINEKNILKDVSKASNALKLSLGGSVEKLAEAAVKTRQFGLNLEQAEKMASGLLQFEDSISNELEAELITGKNLNLEKARGLALNGDAAGAAAEMAKQLGSAADFGKMNVIQQDALAKAVGMNREELSKSLMDKENLSKLGVKDAKTAQEAYNTLKSQGLSEAAIKAKMGKDSETALYEQQSKQDQFNQTIEKLKEIFTNVANVLMPIFDIFSSIFDVVGPIVGFIGDMVAKLKPILTPLLLVVAAFKSISLITKGMVAMNKILVAQEAIKLNTQTAQVAGEGTKNTLKSIGLRLSNSTLGSMIKQSGMLMMNLARYTLIKIESGLVFAANQLTLFSQKSQKTGFIGLIAKGATYLATQLGIAAAAMATNAAMTFGIGVAIAVAAALAGYALVKSMSKVNDGVIGPGAETIVSGPKGSIQLNKDDSMVVGTDLGGKKKPKEGQKSKGGGNVNVDMGPTNALLQQLIGVIQSGGNVMLDGQKVGEALKLTSYETQ